MLLPLTLLGSLIATSALSLADRAPTNHSHTCTGNDNDSPMSTRSAQEIIKKLNMIPNPEKGYYIETFEDPDKEFCSPWNRSASTAIYYLFEASAGHSRWHRMDAAEVWHHYAGAPLIISHTVPVDDGEGNKDQGRDQNEPVRRIVLGPDVFNDQQPQHVVPKWAWQSAQSCGEWSLVGTTAAPGFIESGYEIASTGWEPEGA